MLSRRQERRGRHPTPVLDVDGVLTNAHLVLGPSGEEIKEFSVRDGIGIKVAQYAGIEVVFLSARASEIVKRRAEMLGVTELHQGEQQKLAVVREIAERHGVPTLGHRVRRRRPRGHGVHPGGGCRRRRGRRVHRPARVGSSRHGRARGTGAVRETVESILRSRGDWKDVVSEFLSSI